MSWNAINSILAEATVDEIFCRHLLTNPSNAIQQRRFTLMKEEEEKLCSFEARDLTEFSQHIFVLFGGCREW